MDRAFLIISYPQQALGYHKKIQLMRANVNHLMAYCLMCEKLFILSILFQKIYLPRSLSVDSLNKNVPSAVQMDRLHVKWSDVFIFFSACNTLNTMSYQR